MIYLKENIKILRKQNGWTQEVLAEKLGIKRSLIGAYEEGRAVPKLIIIQQLSILFNISIDQLLTLDLMVENANVDNSFRVLTTVVDNQNEERISIVPVKASAGYLNGLSDPEYVAELPHFAMPVKELAQGKTYRVFQINGDSMLPIPSGSYIFCSYVESFSGIRSGKPYVIITSDDGVVYKRIYDQIEENGTLLLKSDNEEYDPYSIDVNQVLEIWQAIGFLSFELPEPSEMDISKLSSLVYKMQEEIKNLKDK